MTWSDRDMGLTLWWAAFGVALCLAAAVLGIWIGRWLAPSQPAQPEPCRLKIPASVLATVAGPSAESCFEK